MDHSLSASHDELRKPSGLEVADRQCTVWRYCSSKRVDSDPRISCCLAFSLPQGTANADWWFSSWLFSHVRADHTSRDMSSYSALHTEDSDADSIESDSTLTVSKSKRATFGTWTLVVCVTCTLINVATAFFSPSTAVKAPKPFSSYTPAEVQLLRRPNQYIGLEKVARPREQLNFTNHPTVMLPTDSTHPTAVFSDTPKKHSTQVGTVTPEINRFWVTDTVSTLVQFRAIDYGMENCELNVFFPPVGPGEESLSAISIYRLNITYALQTSTLSYATRPPRLPKLADIPLNPSEAIHWHRTFVCPSESVLTFEFACSTSIGHSCNLEFWQDARAKAFGDSAVYVTQRSTI